MRVLLRELKEPGWTIAERSALLSEAEMAGSGVETKPPIRVASAEAEWKELAIRALRATTDNDAIQKETSLNTGVSLSTSVIDLSSANVDLD